MPPFPHFSTVNIEEVAIPREARSATNITCGRHGRAHPAEILHCLFQGIDCRYILTPSDWRLCGFSERPGPIANSRSGLRWCESGVGSVVDERRSYILLITTRRKSCNCHCPSRLQSHWSCCLLLPSRKSRWRCCSSLRQKIICGTAASATTETKCFYRPRKRKAPPKTVKSKLDYQPKRSAPA